MAHFSCNSKLLLIVSIGLIATVYQSYANRNKLYKLAIQAGFNSFEFGVLCFNYIDSNDEITNIEKYGVNAQNDSECSVTMIINDEVSFYSTLAVSGGAIGFGEAYFKGYWSADSEDALISIVYHVMYNKLHKKSNFVMKRFAWMIQYIFSVKHLYYYICRHPLFMNKNVFEDVKSVQAHYDVGNDFYELFLGEKLSGYSCAIFNDKNDTLAQAQDNKWDIIIKKANLERETKLNVLDVGCGWGYFPSYINNKTGHYVVGITISSEQLLFMNRMYGNQLSADQLAYKYLDYRDLYATYGANHFDRAVSVGMLEHVGYNRLNEYFESIWAVLKADSYFVLHYISRMDIHPKFIERSRSTACLQTNFINTFIFPTACTVHTNWVYQAADETGFVLVHEEHYGKHYSKTAHLWQKAMQQNKAKIVSNPRYGEQFFRMYEFYFAFGETALRSGLIELVQQVFYKPASAKTYDVEWDHDITRNPHAENK